jgi:molecular chaperone DnaJ
MVMMSAEHAYAELGLRPGASQSEVKRAWRRLASQWHPDRNDSAEASARMQRINLALAQIRSQGFEDATAAAEAAAAPAPAPAPAPSPPPKPEPASPPPPPPSAAPPASASASASTSASPPEAAPHATSSSYPDADIAPIDPEADDAAYTEGRPLQRCIRLTLEQAAVGCVRTLHGRVVAHCSACDGVGQQVLEQACVPCDGRGSLRQGAWFGWYSLPPTPCTACGGDGLARRPCLACSATGQLAPHDFHIPVRIPHGVRNGDELQVSERRSRVGARVDHPAPVSIHLRVELLPHPLFELDAQDGTLRCEVPIDGFLWIAQRSVEVPTLDAGLVYLSLRRESLVYALPGQGFPVERRGCDGARGDLLVSVLPQFPERLSTDQNILLDQLIATTSGPTSPAPSPGSRLADWAEALQAWQVGRSG